MQLSTETTVLDDTVKCTIEIPIDIYY